MGFAASHFYLYESGAKGEKFPIPVNELQFSWVRHLFSQRSPFRGLQKGPPLNHSEKQITVTSCWAKPARAQKTHPELPERALVECERDLHPPRKRLQRFDRMNIFARSSNSLCEQTAPPRGDASEGRARKHRGPNVPRFSLYGEIKVRQSPGPHDSTPRIRRGYGEGQKRMSKRFSI